MTLHELLDFGYGEDGEATLRRLLEQGADAESPAGPDAEVPLHVATRRRRLEAVTILLDHGADIDATTAGGKTAYAHAARRSFDELTALLAERGADRSLNSADRLAVAVTHGRLDEARQLLAERPELAHTGNPEEDRLLADVAGRNETEPVQLLIAAGADLSAPGLDGGTPLHQAAWFGQPANARLLIRADAPLEVFDPVHASSPIGWAVHGSRYSGDAEGRIDAYVELVQTFLDAGSKLNYPGEPESNAYRIRLLADAAPRVKEVLEQA